MNKRLSEGDKVRRDLVLQLLCAGAVLTKHSNHPLVIDRDGERGFKVKLHEKNPDAPLSPIHFDLRSLNKGVIHFAACCMKNSILSATDDFAALAPIPRAGQPFGKVLSRLLAKPVITLQKIEGVGGQSIVPTKGHSSGIKALIVDDRIITAESKIRALTELRKAGVIVTDVLVLLDCEEEGRKELADFGCTLHSVFTMSQLLTICVETARMTPELRAEIQEYRHAAVA